MEIEVYTARYEREHNQKPAGRRFWRFTLVSSTITAKDHSLVLDEATPYQKALERAMEVARIAEVGADYCGAVAVRYCDTNWDQFGIQAAGRKPNTSMKSTFRTAPWFPPSAPSGTKKLF